MSRAFLLLCLLPATLTACAKDALRVRADALVELRDKTDPLAAYCRSGQRSIAATRMLGLAVCAEPSYRSAPSSR